MLGIDGGQGTRVHAELPPGLLVLYTDGVIEARRDGELYGDERLDAAVTLTARSSPPPSPGRASSQGGPLHLAVVVIRRT